jgi:hypothetical protein
MQKLEENWTDWSIAGFEVLTAVVMKSSKHAACSRLNSCLAYIFDPERGTYIFLQNVSWLSMDYMVLHPVPKRGLNVVFLYIYFHMTIQFTVHFSSETFLIGHNKF